MPPDFAVEYAVYMMHRGAVYRSRISLLRLGNTDKSGFPRLLLPLPTLTQRKASPYTSAVPEKDMILDPRGLPL